MRNILTGFTWAAGLLLLAGCATSPFPAPAPFAGAEGAYEAVPARFAARLAPQFEQVNAVVFRYWPCELATLGMVSASPAKRSFAVTCVTPLGVKLFDAVCENGVVEGRFVHPEFAKHGGNLAQAAGVDLSRAYFDWQPPADAACAVRKGRLVFRAKDATGVTEYRYAGANGWLAEKVRYEGGKTLWAIEYRAFARQPDGLVPTGLVIRNHQYGYRLVVSARENKGKQ